MLYFVIEIYNTAFERWVAWNMYDELQEARAEAERLEADGIRYCLEWVCTQ